MNRQRPQKHQNRTAFKNNLHDTSTKTKFLNSMDVSGVCQKCKNIIEWKIKYKKYKSLTAPKKCVGCEQKTVKHNYHVLCNKCAREKDVCAKCYKKAEVIEATQTDAQMDVAALVKTLPERKRRTVMRFINKLGGEVTPDVRSQIEEMVAKLESTSLDNTEFDSSSDGDSCESDED